MRHQDTLAECERGIGHTCFDLCGFPRDIVQSVAPGMLYTQTLPAGGVRASCPTRMYFNQWSRVFYWTTYVLLKFATYRHRNDGLSRI